MEAITTVLQPLAWVASPTGAAVAVALFLLFVSGIAGRMFSGIEPSAGSGKVRRRGDALAGEQARARISG